jgi:hypothetical protein
MASDDVVRARLDQMIDLRSEVLKSMAKARPPRLGLQPDLIEPRHPRPSHTP